MSDTEFQVARKVAMSESPSPEQEQNSKRKRDAQDDDAGSTPAKKSKKKRKAKKPKDIEEDDLDETLGINRAYSHMDPRLIADTIASRTKRFQPNMSFVELEDLHIPERAILDTSLAEQQRDLEHLPEFLEKFAAGGEKKLKSAPKEKGAPHTLFLASAGLRAADLTRSLRKFQTKECAVAKLFAKHIKLAEAIEMCKNTRMGIGVGTPQRVHDLIEGGALSTKYLRRIVVDASHIDQKKRGILDIKELQIPLVKLLSRKDFGERFGAERERLELIFY